MSEAEYREKMSYRLSELGLSRRDISRIIEAKIRHCEDRAYYCGRSVEEEFELDLYEQASASDCF